MWVDSEGAPANVVAGSLMVCWQLFVEITASQPPQQAFSVRVEQRNREDDEEDDHLDKDSRAKAAHDDGPRKDEGGLDVKNEKEQREDVVANMTLRPAVLYWFDAAFVGAELGFGLAPGLEHTSHAKHRPEESGAKTQEGCDSYILFVIGRHNGVGLLTRGWEPSPVNVSAAQNCTLWP